MFVEQNHSSFESVSQGEKKVSDTWNPAQYQKFSKERTQPFEDLVKLINIDDEMTVVDLGCGTGHLTKQLHDKLKAKKTLGIDSSKAMLKESEQLEGPDLHFELMDIHQFKPVETIDLIFSNAALQWLPNHGELIERLTGYLSERGQIAIQMPFNQDYPTHSIAKDIAMEAPFRSVLGDGRPLFVLPVEEYSQLFYQLGFNSQHVRLQVYPHLLTSTDSIVEWVKGALLTYYQGKLSSDLYELFYQRYQIEIKKYFGEKKPFFLPFKRLLLWASKK